MSSVWQVREWTDGKVRAIKGYIHPKNRITEKKSAIDVVTSDWVYSSRNVNVFFRPIDNETSKELEDIKKKINKYVISEEYNLANIKSEVYKIINVFWWLIWVKRFLFRKNDEENLLERSNIIWTIYDTDWVSLITIQEDTIMFYFTMHNDIINFKQRWIETLKEAHYVREEIRKSNLPDKSEDKE